MLRIQWHIMIRHRLHVIDLGSAVKSSDFLHSASVD